MKYIKLFENKKIELNEYVICKKSFHPNHDENGIMNNFINTSIGQIVGIYHRHFNPYVVKYTNLPKEFYHRNDFFNTTNPYQKDMLCTEVEADDILYHSKDKSELELILSKDVYNI